MDSAAEPSADTKLTRLVQSSSMSKSTDMSDGIKSRTIWAGGIPNKMVGDPAAETVLFIDANRNITSLFSEFGEIDNSTVRVKPGTNKSWALVTFQTAEAATECCATGVCVLDENFEELVLKVEPVVVEGQLKGEAAGHLLLLAKQHKMELPVEEQPSETLWLGGLPEELLGSNDKEATVFVTELCGQFGEVMAASVRVKPGRSRGSWALVTFRTYEAVQLAVARGVTAAVDGEEIELKALAADVEKELQKGTTGYLAHTNTKHEKEVEAARKLVRAWYAENGGRKIEKSLARFRATDMAPQVTAEVC